MFTITPEGGEESRDGVGGSGESLGWRRYYRFLQRVFLWGWRIISPTTPTSLQPDSARLFQQAAHRGKVWREREKERGREGRTEGKCLGR